MNQGSFKILVLFSLGFIVFSGGGVPQYVVAEEPLQCPQPRFTQKAPDKIYHLKNPLEATPENLKKGEMLYQMRAKPMPCKLCHGAQGDGRGSMSRAFDPPPRDFTCDKTIKGVPDGQLFWIIKNGSPGTGMPAYRNLEETQIWQILHYIRGMAP